MLLTADEYSTVCIWKMNKGINIWNLIKTFDVKSVRHISWLLSSSINSINLAKKTVLEKLTFSVREQQRNNTSSIFNRTPSFPVAIPVREKTSHSTTKKFTNLYHYYEV